MTERVARRPGLLATALAHAEAWLLEPPGLLPAAPAPPPALRPVVAVVGVAPRCGATTVARGLALALAERDPVGAALVAGRLGRPAGPIGTPAASRLARTARELAGGRVRVAGRLCLCEGSDPVALVSGARPLAPVVLDSGQECVGLADAVVIVAAHHSEPALASALAITLARAGPQPRLVLNRFVGEEADGRWHAHLPEGRAAARAALAGCPAPGRLGRGLAALADLVA